MEFRFTPTQPDGGGSLTFVATGADEVDRLLDHFRLFQNSPTDKARAILAERFEYTSFYTKRPWYQVEGQIGEAFLAPYAKLLTKLTGYTGPWPETELTDVHPARLCHTHITNRLWLVAGPDLRYEAFDESEPWNGLDAKTYAEKRVLDCVRADFGFRKHEREFIWRGGHYIQNPDYLKHHPASPGLGSEWFWTWLFAWWRTNYASSRQRELLDAHDQLHSRSKLDPGYALRASGQDQLHLVSYTGLEVADPAGKLDWDGKGTKFRQVSWEDFAAMAETHLHAYTTDELPSDADEAEGTEGNPIFQPEKQDDQ